jgi:hypothetical protein
VMDSGEQEVDDICISVLIDFDTRPRRVIRRCGSLSLSLSFSSLS